jgi:hypothetical protein
MRFSNVLCAALAMTPLCLGQLTTEQKQFDFRSLASIYAKRYGPAEWTRTAFGFDLLDIDPWLDRVARTTSDLDFYDVMVEYVASLRDTHAAYQLPSSFTATLGLSADIYDGKVLINAVNRSALPVSRFPFVAGDEIVSLDGRPISEWINSYEKYAIQGNPRATRRRVVERVLTRSQSRNPRAPEVGDTASVVIQRRDGILETYDIPWNKSGLAITTIDPAGPVMKQSDSRSARASDDPLLELQHAEDPDPSAVLGVGSLQPAFSLPETFQQRLGKESSDYFYSGTYDAGGYRIGFIRIPSYNPMNFPMALTQFRIEIGWMQENTDGLVVDEMRNPGGTLCYGEDIVALLIPSDFTPLGYEIRATWEYMQSFYSKVQSARNANAPASVIDQYQMLFDKVQSAWASDRGRTEPVPVCTPSFNRSPARDSNGNVIAYKKPLIMLTDEFSASTADSVPAMIQDNKRGLLVGYRTNGAGGSNSLSTERWQVGVWSEGDTGVTLSLMVRKDPVATPEFPVTRYIENVGVRPDVELDLMTNDNLLNQGRPFADAFTGVIVKQIQASKQ